MYTNFVEWLERMNGHRSDLTKKTLLPVSQHCVAEALVG